MMRITTTAPIPRGTDWLQLLTGRDRGVDSMREVWKEGGIDTVWFSRGAWAFHAVALALQEKLKRPPSIWFPDYFCHQPLQALGGTDARVVFYPVNSALEPDWELCSKLASAEKPDLFVLVHYFGYAADAARARLFVQEAGALLLEDAAHAIGPSAGIGQTGDFVLYSLYKHCALPDGAALQVRDSETVVAGFLNVLSETARGPAPSPVSWLAKRALQSVLPGIGNVRNTPSDLDDDPGTVAPDVTPAMSAMSRRLLGQARDRFDRAAARRRANAAALHDLFGTADGLSPLHPDAVADSVPYRAVFRARNHDTARLWYRRIRESGNVVESWPDLPPEVLGDPATHKAALELRRTMLCLPIHADRTPHQLKAAYGVAL
jgi:hypothetical protein